MQFSIFGLCFLTKIITTIMLKFLPFIMILTVIFSFSLAVLSKQNILMSVLINIFPIIAIFLLNILSGFAVKRINGFFSILTNEKKDNKIIFDSYEKNFPKISESPEILKKYENCLDYFDIDKEKKISFETIEKSYKIKYKKIRSEIKQKEILSEKILKVNKTREFLNINLKYYLMKRGL